MLKKLSGLKDILWALGIIVCLGAFVIVLFVTAATRYSGEKQERALDLGSLNIVDEGTAQDIPADAAIYGQLRKMPETKDAGEEYLSTLTFLTDSIMVGLRDSVATTPEIWGSEAGNLPMNAVADWEILYSDSSRLSVSNACMVVKPKILVIAVGSDALASMDHDSFVTAYTNLIQTVRAASPETKIVCCSVLSVTGFYTSLDGLTADMTVSACEWVQEVCTNTGCYYADLGEELNSGLTLSDGYAGANGKSLNAAGLAVVLSYFRHHALS